MASRPSLQTRPQDSRGAAAVGHLGKGEQRVRSRHRYGGGFWTSTEDKDASVDFVSRRHLRRSTAAVLALPCQSQWYFDATTSLALCCRIFEEMNMDREEAGEGGEQRSKENMGVNRFFARQF